MSLLVGHHEAALPTPGSPNLDGMPAKCRHPRRRTLRAQPGRSSGARRAVAVSPTVLLLSSTLARQDLPHRKGCYGPFHAGCGRFTRGADASLPT